MSTNIVTPQNPLNRVAVASVGASYPAADWSATKPTSGIMYDMTSGLLQAENFSLVNALPFATTTWTTSGSTTGVRFVGWNSYTSADGNVFWIGSVIADISLLFTSGSVQSIAIDAVNHRPFSGVTQQSGTPIAYTYSPFTSSSAATDAARVLIDPIGFQLLQAQFKAATGTPTMGVFYTGV
jgi:hypothetical protein